MDSPSQTFASIAVIIIEDSDDDYRLLLRKLRATSMQVEATQVQNAAELQDALARERYDAVISDHRLPAFSSFDALKLVRELDPDLPFLIVSGTIGEDLAVEAMRAGADDYLLKERLGRLLPALERALKVAANRRGRRRAAWRPAGSQRAVGRRWSSTLHPSGGCRGLGCHRAWGSYEAQRRLHHFSDRGSSRWGPVQTP